MKVWRLAIVAILASQMLVVSAARAEEEMSNFKANVEGAGWLLPTLTLHVVLAPSRRERGARDDLDTASTTQLSMR